MLGSSFTPVEQLLSSAAYVTFRL